MITHALLRQVRMIVLALAVSLALAVVPAASGEVRPQATTPKILSSGFSNPIAYEQKSLQTTTFRFSADTRDVRATLKLKTASGDLTIGDVVVIAPPGTEIGMVPWDGRDARGKRLPSGVYTWVLTVTKDGQSATATGKVIVSKICLGFRDWAVYALRKHPVYMVEGPVNLYVSTASVHGAGLEIAVDGGGSMLINPDETRAVYLRGGDAVETRGLRDVRYRATVPDGYVDTRVTVVQ